MSKHAPYPPTPFYDRLTLLSKLEDGWLDGHGKKPTPEALKQAACLGPALFQDAYLYVYPTEVGGVSLEWNDQHGSHEVEVLPDGHLWLMTVEPAGAAGMGELRRKKESNLEALRKRAETAEGLLKQCVDLVAVTHKYPITGGHDCLGENHSCAGCALAKQAQEHLDRTKEGR